MEKGKQNGRTRKTRDEKEEQQEEKKSSAVSRPQTTISPAAMARRETSVAMCWVFAESDSDVKQRRVGAIVNAMYSVSSVTSHKLSGSCRHQGCSLPTGSCSLI